MRLHASMLQLPNNSKSLCSMSTPNYSPPPPHPTPSCQKLHCLSDSASACIKNSQHHLCQPRPAHAYVIIAAVKTPSQPGMKEIDAAEQGLVCLQPIVREGDKCNRLFIVDQGLLSSKGRLLGCGALVGEQHFLLDKGRWSHSANTVTYTRLLTLDKDTFDE